MKRMSLERKEQISGDQKEIEFAQKVQKAMTHCRFFFCSEKAECTLLWVCDVTERIWWKMKVERRIAGGNRYTEKEKGSESLSTQLSLY